MNTYSLALITLTTILGAPSAQSQNKKNYERTPAVLADEGEVIVNREFPLGDLNFKEGKIRQVDGPDYRSACRFERVDRVQYVPQGTRLRGAHVRTDFWARNTFMGDVLRLVHAPQDGDMITITFQPNPFVESLTCWIDHHNVKIKDLQKELGSYVSIAL